MSQLARQVFWLVPAATPSRPEPVAKECAAIDGTYSSGNCCRISRHSHLITRGLARPFVNHCGAKLKNKFVSLPTLTKIHAAEFGKIIAGLDGQFGFVDVMDNVNGKNLNLSISVGYKF